MSLRAGEVAQAAGVNRQTLRYYERRGLLAEPDRSPGGHRLYDDQAVTTLRVIKAAQRLGFTLDEIGHVINMYDETPGERGQLAFLIADIGKRRETLFAKRRDLDEALAELDDLEERCRADLERLSDSL